MSDTLFSSSDGIDADVVEAALAELAAMLPELRKLPGFPIGSDEDILKMSLPPYYTACPNPFIEEWLEASAPDGYKDREYVDPGPFASDVSAGKGHRFYRAHAFWTKVPHEAIMRYLLHYTRPGDVVFDGFAGSGMTGVAAQSCAIPDPEFRATIENELGGVEWGARRVVLQDLGPAATYIEAGMTLPLDPQGFDFQSQEILDGFESDYAWMYETMHEDGTVATIDYTLWSEVFTCPKCGGEIVYYDAAFDAEKMTVSDSFDCPTCGVNLNKRQAEKRYTVEMTLAGDVQERSEFRPVRVFYRVDGEIFEKIPDVEDLARIARARSLDVPTFPSGEIPISKLWHGYMFEPSGITRMHHFWSPRALVALADIWARAERTREPDLRLSLLFWVEQAIWGLSWMNRYMAARYSQTNRQMMGVYYFPSLHAEVHPRMNLEGRIPSKGKRQSLGRLWSRQLPEDVVRISTGSSSSVLLPDESVDYVFVDPPFGLNIQYADLNRVVESWHQVMTNDLDEAVVHKVKGVTIDDYTKLLTDCFDEFFRVLKAGRWMTVEFSNSSNAIWLALQEAIASAGFVIADTRILDKKQGSWIQVRRPNAVKRDIVLSAYKPSTETEARFEIVGGSPEGAWEFVSEHLSHLPVVEGMRGQGALVRERFADRLYDRMVAYHVHRSVSVPLTAAEFYSGVEQRFPVRDDMYFLPEQVEEYERHRMTFKDLAQLEMFITGEASAVQWLRQQLKKKPRTYAEIQPLFFDELQAGLPDWEELPELRELLEESFLQDDQDRWFVPDPKKSVDLEAQRTKGLLKEFELYVLGKGKLSSFRSEAVRAGFKDAWGRRDFGTLVAVGERLPADAFVEDEALLYYYDNARRLLPEAE